jgi:hypothetical protein
MGKRADIDATDLSPNAKLIIITCILKREED